MSSYNRLLRRQIRCKRRELRKSHNESVQPLKRDINNKSLVNSLNNYSKTFTNILKTLKSHNITSPFLSQFKNSCQYNQKNIFSGGYTLKQLRFIEEKRNVYGRLLTSVIIR